MNRPDSPIPYKLVDPPIPYRLTKPRRAPGVRRSTCGICKRLLEHRPGCFYPIHIGGGACLRGVGDANLDDAQLAT